MNSAVASSHAESPPEIPKLAEAPAPWNLPRRIAFRFAFAYLVLYNLPFPLTEPPKTEKLDKAYDWLWHKIVPWFGKHVLHLAKDITVFPNGSGDTTYNYVQLLCYALIAFTATLIWSIADRRRLRYDRLWALLRIYLRYVLALTMFSYGFAKVFPYGQFPPLTPGRLSETFGEASPMGMVWAFMGASRAYTMFSGWAEVVGGALLLFRRTTTLGALVLIAVIGNVVMLNFCYDVCVKLYSLHLWLMALFLLLPEIGRLIDVLVLHRPTVPARIQPFVIAGRPWIAWVLKLLLVGNGLYHQIDRQLEQTKKFGAVPQGALSGAWSVEQLSRDGGPALRGRLAASNRAVYFTMSDGTSLRYGITDDGLKKMLTLLDWASNKPVGALSYVRTGTDVAALDGVVDGHRIHAQLRRIDTSKSLLVTRGFHWINEQPFNR
jgi:hypothetical protein